MIKVLICSFNFFIAVACLRWRRREGLWGLIKISLMFFCNPLMSFIGFAIKIFLSGTPPQSQILSTSQFHSCWWISIACPTDFRRLEFIPFDVYPGFVFGYVMKILFVFKEFNAVVKKGHNDFFSVHPLCKFCKEINEIQRNPHWEHKICTFFLPHLCSEMRRHFSTRIFHARNTQLLFASLYA